jgi:hypothetical protein
VEDAKTSMRMKSVLDFHSTVEMLMLNSRSLVLTGSRPLLLLDVDDTVAVVVSDDDLNYYYCYC